MIEIPCEVAASKSILQLLFVHSVATLFPFLLCSFNLCSFNLCGGENGGGECCAEFSMASPYLPAPCLTNKVLLVAMLLAMSSPCIQTGVS